MRYRFTEQLNLIDAIRRAIECVPSIYEATLHEGSVEYGEVIEDVSFEFPVYHVENCSELAAVHSFNKVETIAGCINSIHDLMGMIIETNPPAEAKNAESNKIYLKDGLFYIKGLSYKYNALDLDKDTDINFDEIDGFSAYEPIPLRDFSKGPYFQAQINYAVNPEESEITEDYF
jgi:hypothetical protein